MSYSLDLSTLHRSGSDNKFHVTVIETDKDMVLEEMFPVEQWNCIEAFHHADVVGYEPMTAKELETEEQQDNVLNSKDYFIEEKFDGTRAIVQFFKQECLESGEVVDEEGWCRVFSRRISKKTGFYVENTDSLPQIREINVPELAGTVLDGEMFINGLPFREVSSTLNCLWDKAIDRQLEKGFITFHAFDILKYKGIDLRKMPLERRKVYLHMAVEEADSPYIEEVKYYECGAKIDDLEIVSEVIDRIGAYSEDQFYDELLDNKDTYPNLYDCWKNGKPITPRAYYELIVATGGEGVIVKPKSGKYLHKRGWEYSKIKKFLTRELILIGFSEPTREYAGKAPKNWAYYEGDTPVTKHYYNKQVGNMILGVLISDEEYQKIPKDKRGAVHEPYKVVKDLDEAQFNSDYHIMEVCECTGYNDEMREYFTRNQKKLVGTVVEIKANEIMRDSGRLRHPRFLRQRFDKEPERCTWKEHII